MEFRIMSHRDATLYSPKNEGFASAAIIRITSMTEFLPLWYRHEFSDVLELFFDDVTEETLVQLIHQGNNKHNLVMFNQGHAEKIVEFFNVHKTSCDAFVVHCDAGVSRSAAVAMSLAKYSGHIDAYTRIITNVPAYCPNPHVRQVMADEMGVSVEQQQLYNNLFGANC